MKAMILAAGRGERMMPLTLHTPKPLLLVGDKPLLQYHIENFADAGIRDIVINHSYLGEQIENYFENGHQLGVSIQYSKESEPLETAGGIKQALPMLDSDRFIVINGDIFTDFSMSTFMQSQAYFDFCNPKINRDFPLAHLILVSNPAHNQAGDFALSSNKVSNHQTDRLTFSGIGLYHRQLFEQCETGKKAPLAPILRTAIEKNRVTGSKYNGMWTDVGTPERLSQLNASSNKKAKD